jgi:hypothetical protein
MGPLRPYRAMGPWGLTKDPNRIRDSKNGQLAIALDPGSDFHNQWMTEVLEEENKHDRKHKRQHGSQPSLTDACDSADSDDCGRAVVAKSTGKSTGFVTAQYQELCGIWWPDYVFEREEGRKLAKDEVCIEIIEGVKRKGCWRFERGAADVVGSVRVTNTLGKPFVSHGWDHDSF